MTNQLETVQQYIEAFNKSDVEGMAAVFAESGTILDGMAPHFWSGTAATRDWYRDVLTESEHLHAADYHVTLGEPLHNNVTGDSAYVVVPASMKFNLQGKPVSQAGAFFTVALRQFQDKWRITAWAWTKGK